jgi:signal transduction histidine kinase
MKFAIKLSALLSAIIIVFGLAISLFIYQSNLNILKENEIHHLQDIVSNILDNIDRNFFERYNDIKGLVGDLVISSRNSTAKEITERLIAFRNTYKTYVSVSFFDTNRIRIADTSGMDIGKQNELELYFKESAQGGISAASDVKMSSTLNQPIIYFASPVKDETNEIFGVVVARVPITKLYEITKEAAGIHEGEESMVDLIDKDGLLLYSNHNQKGILKGNLTEWESFQRSRAGEKFGNGVHTDPGEEEMIYVFAHEQGYFDFKGNDWTLVIHVPTRIAFLPAVELRNLTIIILLLSIAFVLPIAFFFSKTITTPITKLRDIAIKISKGEYEHQIKIKTGDEIETLSDAFNTLSINLKKSQEKLQGYSRNLEKKVNERTKQLDKKIKESEETRIATLNILEDAEETRIELDKTYKELKKLDKMKAEFMNISAHELKTPLIPIIGYLDMIIKGDMGKINPKEKESLAIALRSAQRLQRLVSDILNISKLETGAMKFYIDDVSLTALISNLVESMMPFANEKKIKLTSKIDKNLPLIKGDISRITEVFENLINNAIKFTEKGEVLIESKIESKNIIISVKDSGIGMNKEFIKKKLFKKFQQEDSTERRKYSGTGLGLAICKSIIERHKGRIWAESEVGKGSTFYVSLPIKI